MTVTKIDHRLGRQMDGAGRAMGPPFTVLLGADYSGKSSALVELADSCEVVSVDDEFLVDGRGVVRALKRALVKEVLPALDDVYTVDFAISLLQTAVVHLRDRIASCSGVRPVVVDSYYYKILAKCRLLSGKPNPAFDWWRSFPKPEQVIYLEVDPVTAWRRCGDGARINRLEHHGTEPIYPAFVDFQRELKVLMLEEVEAAPIRVIPERAGVAATVAEIREAMVRRVA
ncbi:hypothetical protein [Amycolatopsis sp. H20-H5]|uniref:hypothetical protein n=1 Tax=Amycolatopsis sp. H20-H5 TaxID=3046309 RepID=UPI002DB568FD|nr:hypothetical protein [Amycolatopsis sp. H20-H5]MEC3974981.1 hypothetical protein [Amycolatopsis sp. H20-H5]